MRLPLSVDGRDVLVQVAADDVSVGELTAACGATADARIAVDGRPLSADQFVHEAALRPGDQLTVDGAEATTRPAPGGWAVHVIAGVDAGRLVPLPAPAEGANDPSGAITIRVGRAAGMDVRLASNAVSKHHCTVVVDGGAITVRDEGSRNGTVVRGVRVGSDGTEVDVNEPIRCGPAVVSVRAIGHPDPPQSLVNALATAASGPVPFHRSPVDLAPAPVDDVPLPPAPRTPRTGRPGLLMIVLPVLVAAALVWFTGQWFYAIFALMTPVMMLFTTLERAGRNRRVRKRSRRRYRTEVAEFREDLSRAVDHEQRRRRTIHPDPVEVVRRAVDGSAALWSRRPHHPEFMQLSLGLVDMPWDPPVQVVPDEQPDLEAMVTDAAVLRMSPLALAATPGVTIGLSGDRMAALACARGLVLQTAVEHGPAEVRVVLVTGSDHTGEWEWAKWLPHVRPTFAEGSLLTVVADAEGRIDAAAIDTVLADAESGAVLLVVVDTVGLADAGDQAIRRLLRRAGHPVTGIVVAATADGLPDHCEVVVEHHDSIGEATCRWPKLGGRNLEFVIGGVTVGTATAAARGLARLADPDAGGGSASLPARVGVAELLGLTGATAAGVAEAWSHGRAPTPVVGIGAHGACAVDLGRDGPHLVVVGGRGSGKTEHLTSIVLSLAAQLPPTRLHLVLWGESFSSLHRLPHVASHLNRIDDTAVDLFLKALDRELTRRERVRSSDGAEAIAERPALVVVIDDVDSIMRLVPIATDELVRLWRRARGLGVHIVWSSGRGAGGTIDDLFDLSPLRVVLRVATVHESTELIGSESAARLERSLPGRGYLVAGRAEAREVQGGLATVGAPRPEGRVDVTTFALAGGRDRVAGSETSAPDDRTLVSVIAAAGANAPRPPDLLSPAEAVVADVESPGLLEMLGIEGVAGLADIAERWHTVDVDSLLQVPIGVDPDMRPVVLDVKESALAGMGPHGLLVGATGSGKSELLRTLVAGLAVTHSPEVLSFLLVDFKGGASFANLGRIPHAAGLVTNLVDDMAAIDRILAALDGEQRRRQELLARAGNLANVREYRAARRAGRLPAELADVPLPELMVVVDEFAELLDQQPEFIDWFLTIGRVGRSLGIHLLLASQRLEEGKLRGLDTYLSYRLGLRTFSAAESRIVLGVPDAYSLPQAPGGGYLKVGSSSFQRFQASYVSGPADPSAADDGTLDGALSVLDAVVGALEQAAEPVHQIWLSPLGDAVALDSLFGADGFVHDPRRGFAAARWPGTGRLAIPVGLVDEPERQRQSPLILDFAGAHGHVALCGAPQTGKSTFLRTAVLALAATHTADEAQVYAVDFGGGTLDSLAGLPHVGAVASRLEPERVERLVAHVARLLAEREERFRAEGIDSVATMRARRDDDTTPAGSAADVFLLIDGWAAFREQFEALEPVIADLVGRGLGYGIHVVVTANRWMELRANVLDSIGGRLELRSNNPADSLIDRRRAAVIRPDQPGRGLHPSRHLFQVALPRLDGQASASKVQEATLVAVDHIAARWDGARAAPVRMLPALVTVDELVGSDAGASVGDTTSLELGADGVVVGLAEADMEPWVLDLAGSDPHFFVYGDSESGKTTFLRTLMTGLAQRIVPERAQLVLVDYRRTSLEVVPPSHLHGYAAAEPAAVELIARVAAEATRRLPGADVTPAQLRDRSWWDGPELFVVVDDYDLVATPSGNPLSPLLPLLAQGRDVGLHLILARRVAGAGQTMYEPITARTREVSPHGLILSGDRDEGPLIGQIRAAAQPVGRGILVRRRHRPGLVQVAVRSPA